MRNKVEKLNELSREIKNCKKCRLWKTRAHALPGEGHASSDLMLIAQAPGTEEDKEGVMFVGPSGGKLNELLSKAEVSREEVFMTNLIKCMLPDYRKPRQDEIDACSSFLEREIKLVDPIVICTLGYFSTKYIFEKNNIRDKLNFPEICGIEHRVKEKIILPLGHPAALFYDDSIEKEMIEDYKKIGELKRSI